MSSLFQKIFNLFSKRSDPEETRPASENTKPPEPPVITTTVKPSSISFSIGSYNSDDDAETVAGNSSFVPNKNFSFNDYDSYCDKVNTFTVIDFETANQFPDSICQIGIAVVKDCVFTEIKSFLIKPPYDDFRNSRIHGITAKTVKDAPTFAELWPTIKPYIENQLLAAYNARFDIGCLEAAFDRYGIPSPDYAVFDILQAARQISIPMKNHKLATVAKTLLIKQEKAHDAGDDARVAAEVQLYAYHAEKYLYNTIYFITTDNIKMHQMKREIMSGDFIWREISLDYQRCKDLPFEECTDFFNSCKLAVEKGCTNARLYRAYGELLEKSGDTDNALLMYQKALSLNEKIGLKKKVEKMLKNK